MKSGEELYNKVYQSPRLQQREFAPWTSGFFIIWKREHLSTIKAKKAKSTEKPNATRWRRSRNENSWKLVLNSEGANGPVDQRDDFKLVTGCTRSGSTKDQNNNSKDMKRILTELIQNQDGNVILLQLPRFLLLHHPGGNHPTAGRLKDTSDVPEARPCHKYIYKLKGKDKATFYSPAEEWILPAASTKEPEEREFVVESGVSMHMVSKRDLNSAELRNRKSL